MHCIHQAAVRLAVSRTGLSISQAVGTMGQHRRDLVEVGVAAATSIAHQVIPGKVREHLQSLARNDGSGEESDKCLRIAGQVWGELC